MLGKPLRRCSPPTGTGGVRGRAEPELVQRIGAPLAFNGTNARDEYPERLGEPITIVTVPTF